MRSRHVVARRRTGGWGGRSPPAVELIGITKRFGRVVACDRVDLTLHAGAVHGILGENGAGKSTLMKVLIGLVLPDAGQIRLAGAPVRIDDPVDAAAHGIGMVHQHFSLVEAPHRVGERGARRRRPARPPSRARTRGGDQRAVRAADRPRRPHRRPAGRHAPAGRDHQVPPPRPGGARVRRADVGAVAGGVGLPVRGAAPRRRARGEGGRAGQPQAARGDGGDRRDHHHARRPGRRDRATARATPASLARAMVGRDVSLRGDVGLRPGQHGPGDGGRRSRQAPLPTTARRCCASSTPRCAAATVGCCSTVLARRAPRRDRRPRRRRGQRPAGARRRAVEPARARLRRGRGRRLERSRRAGPGRWRRPASPSSPRIATTRDACSTSPSPRTSSSPTPSASPARPDGPAADARRRRRTLIDRFAITCTGPDAPMWSLSGGNQQRVVLARELSHDPRVLVAAQPTRGLDVGAIEYMSERLARRPPASACC